MPQLNKNRVTSSKTPRGSQHPDSSVGYTDIVQPAKISLQPMVTMEGVNRILEVGKLLRAVLTPDELSSLGNAVNAHKQRKHADY